MQSRPGRSFAILPPPRARLPGNLRNIETNTRKHDDLLAEMQRFRGRAYLKDGAIRAGELTADGRHQQLADDHGWHVLSLGTAGEIVACLRYVEEPRPGGLDDLAARCPALGAKFQDAVGLARSRAQQMRLGFGEVGGWAVAETRRRTMEPLRIILATYGLLQLLGSCCGVATATFRHSSAAILRRIGLTSLLSDGQALPPYFDPYYGCQMEVLQFDSRFPNPKYSEKVVELSACLAVSQVIPRGV